MMRSTFKLVGRCHTWCPNHELVVGRAREKRNAQRDVEEQLVAPLLDLEDAYYETL